LNAASIAFPFSKGTFNPWIEKGKKISSTLLIRQASAFHSYNGITFSHFFVAGQ
jgi:hypothetical protein